MANLETAISGLVSRLEAITSRLENVEKTLASGGAPSTTGGTSGSSGSTSASVEEYDALINQFIKPYVELSQKIDKDVNDQAQLVLQAVNAQKAMLAIAAASKKPSDADFQKLLKPTSDLMAKIVAIKDKGRASKFFNNLSTAAEGIAALGWVCITPTPAPHIADMRGGSEFYSNRILKDFKGKDQVQVDWVTNFNGFLKELQAYVKKNHTTGLTWNPKGGDVNAAAAAPPSAPAPPPPGPPPPAPPPVAAASTSAAPDMNNVFAQINKGEGITSGLKKVTSDMKTKNRTDKSSVVPAIEKKETATKAGKPAVTKPPKLALEGNKWVVEYFVDNKEIVISDTEAKQTVYIYKCKNCTIQIKGKVNAITLDDCAKSAIVFENAIASFEVVNSTSVEIQVLGRVPSIAVDKTSGCQLYLSKETLDVEIVTSKSSEMNVTFPDKSGELVEIAIPEQYKSKVQGNKLNTEIVAHV